MNYTLRSGALSNTKNKLRHLTVAAIVAVTAVSGAMPLVLSHDALAAPTYSTGFEQNNVADWTGFGGAVPAGTVTRTASNSVGIPASSGNYYATITGPAYTKWGGYENSFSTNGYTTKLDVYLAASAADGSDKRFDFSSAINNTAGNHLRDFIFAVGTQPGVNGSWIANVTNNAPGDPSLVNGVTLPGDAWYTLESNFHNDGEGNLGVRMTIINATTKAVVKYWDMPTTDTIATVGGHRYGWFTASRFDLTDLAIDNARLAQNPAPTKVFVDDDYIAGGTNDDHIYGYDAFKTIEAGLAAVAANGTVTIGDGVYNNVQLNDTYASNILVRGLSKPTINGLDLTGSTFNGLAFRNFNFTGDSLTGYGNYSFTIGGDGSYQNLSIVNSVFNGQNNSDRGAIFMNRGLTGFVLDNNSFRNYNNSGSVYSLVFAEAQGPAMGDQFVATNNTLNGSTATNFIETYRWKNVTISGNTANATSGRILVWSNDADSLEDVTISGNMLTLTAGTGIGVFYAPSTTATVDANTIVGAATCMKINSVSNTVITNNIFKNCTVSDLEFAATGSTQPVSATVTGNTFSTASAFKNTSGLTIDTTGNTYADAPAVDNTPTPTPTSNPTSTTATAAITSTTSTVGSTGSNAATGIVAAGTNAAASVLGLSSGIASDSTNKSATSTPKKQDAKDSANFLGLGWWWILVAAVVAAVGYYYGVVRRSQNA